MPNIWPRTQIFSEIKIKMLGFFIVNLLDRISASLASLGATELFKFDLRSLGWSYQIRMGSGAITDRAGGWWWWRECCPNQYLASDVSVIPRGPDVYWSLSGAPESVTGAGAGAKCDVTRRVGWCQLLSAPPVRPWVTLIMWVYCVPWCIPNTLQLFPNNPPRLRCLPPPSLFAWHVRPRGRSYPGLPMTENRKLEISFQRQHVTKHLNMCPTGVAWLQQQQDG